MERKDKELRGSSNDFIRDVNVTMAEALERETKRARKEEWGQNKF